MTAPTTQPQLTEAWEIVKAVLETAIQVVTDEGYFTLAGDCERALALLPSLKPEEQQPEQPDDCTPTRQGPEKRYVEAGAFWEAYATLPHDLCPEHDRPCSDTFRKAFDAAIVKLSVREASAQHPAPVAELERVARAICRSYYQDPDFEYVVGSQESPLLQRRFFLWENYISAAREAIAAISHPLTPAEREDAVRLMSDAIHVERVKPMREGSWALAEAALSALEAKGMLKGGA